MGYFVKYSEDQEEYISQTYDRISFRSYLKDIGIGINELYRTYELEEKYKDEFVAWLALKRMGVELWM